eukprot:gene14764-20815_t
MNWRQPNSLGARFLREAVFDPAHLLNEQLSMLSTSVITCGHCKHGAHSCHKPVICGFKGRMQIRQEACKKVYRGPTFSAAPTSSRPNADVRAHALVGGEMLPAFQSLFVSSSAPVIKVLLLCSVGAICASKGLLDSDGRRIISGLVVNVFTPCLFFAKMGNGIGVKEVIQLWPLTVNMASDMGISGYGDMGHFLAIN